MKAFSLFYDHGYGVWMPKRWWSGLSGQCGLLKFGSGVSFMAC